MKRFLARASLRAPQTVAVYSPIMSASRPARTSKRKTHVFSCSSEEATESTEEPAALQRGMSSAQQSEGEEKDDATATEAESFHSKQPWPPACHFCSQIIAYSHCQPVVCPGCSERFHFNCYNAHIPCGRVRHMIEMPSPGAASSGDHAGIAAGNFLCPSPTVEKQT